jgi:hypothetical protein
VHRNAWRPLGISTPNIPVQKCLVATKRLSQKHSWEETFGDYQTFLLSSLFAKTLVGSSCQNESCDFLFAKLINGEKWWFPTIFFFSFI